MARGIGTQENIIGSVGYAGAVVEDPSLDAPLDENSTTTFSNDANADTATLTGTATVSSVTNFLPGTQPRVVYCAGGNGKILTFPGVVAPGADFTLEGYLRITTATGNLMGIHVGDATNYYSLTSDGTSFAMLGPSGSIFSEASQIADATYYHFCMMRKSNTLYGFLDGVLKGSGSLSGVTTPTVGSAGIGCRYPGSFTGTDFWLSSFRAFTSARYSELGFVPPVPPYT